MIHKSSTNANDSRSPTIRSIIFDMDGVLVDSEPLWHKAEIMSFATVGVKLTDQMCLQTTGLRVDEVVEYWFSRYPWDGAAQKDIEDLIWKNIIQLVKDCAIAKAGVYESLSFFKENGYTLAIASTSAMVLINTVVDKLKIRDYFETLHSAEFEEYGKPHPAVYLHTAKKLGRKPAECVAIEDSVNGVIAAKAAKMKCIAVPEVALFNDRRLGIADVVISSLLDIDKQTLASIA